MLEAILRAFSLLTLFLPASSEPVKVPTIKPTVAVVDQMEEYQWRR
jgi:hypothetical protein